MAKYQSPTMNGRVDETVQLTSWDDCQNVRGKNSPTRSLSPVRTKPRQIWGALRHVHKLVTRPLGRVKSRAVTVTAPDEDSDDNGDPLLCLPNDNPFFLAKLAARGNLEEFVKVYEADPERLSVKDTKGQGPLHAAAAKGHRNIVDFIVQQNGCLDIINDVGDTALHVAVRHNQTGVVEALLEGEADHTILNNDHMAPLHLACSLGFTHVTETLLKDPAVRKDIHIKGETGRTPLHVACEHDQSECAKILLQHGAKPCRQCDMGTFPIHLAAKSASANALEILIQEGIKHGYTRASLLSFKDKENNMPLHAAVIGGDIKVVEVCVKAGALVNTQQDDLSTPVHFAAAQGNLDMLKLMQSMQEDNFMSAIRKTDAMGMTPLHRAALFNHKAIVSFLLKRGADINSQDTMGDTPLLLATSKGCWDTVHFLLDNGADVGVRDRNSLNILHVAIRYGGKLGQLFDATSHDPNATHTDGSAILKSKAMECLRKMLDERDKFGCTPMHYASKEGNLQALEHLISSGATPSLKNNEKQSPFHFAARYGRYNTCRRLLELSQGPNIINETDADGLTGLHIAAQNGHNKIITLLLQKGAVMQKDNDDNTPFHYAAAQGWTWCMKTLMAVHSNLMDVKNIRGETALHLAAQNGRVSAVSLLLTMGASLERDEADKTFVDYIIDLKDTEVAMAVVKHERWEEALINRSVQYGCLFIGIIAHMPDVCEAILNRCQVCKGDKESAQYCIEYNYKFLSTPVGCIEIARKSGKYQPMMNINAMVQHGQVNCLSHPVCVSFLKMKWNTYGMWLNFLVLGLYVLFLTSLTYFIVNFDSFKHFDSYDVDNKTADMLGLKSPRMDHMNPMYKSAIWVVVVFSILNMVKEVMQMIAQRARYFSDIQNIFEWTLYITSTVFAGPFIFHFSYHWQWEAGALAIFLAWFNFLLTLQRFEFFGIYVVMFVEILRTLVQALCVFSVLFVAFGLSFYMQLKDESNRAYKTPALSLMRTMMMMMELDFMASFDIPYTDDDNTTLHFGNMTFFMVIVFVILMPILLMNLLIGLAVGDIESVQRNARLKRLAGQVQLHSDMERKMPLFMLNYFEKAEQKMYPNKCRNRMSSLWNRLTETDLEDKNGHEASTINGVTLIEELAKQKKKVKEINSLLEKNNELLRLIVQKMEIQTEDDAFDEGYNHDSECPSRSSSVANGPQTENILKTSSYRKSVIMQKTSIVSYMKRMKDKDKEKKTPPP